jgi:hypothetical protein
MRTRFHVHHVACVYPEPSDHTLLLEVAMTTQQMHDALGQFLTRITSRQWDEWLEEYAPEYHAALNLDHAAVRSAAFNAAADHVASSVFHSGSADGRSV